MKLTYRIYLIALIAIAFNAYGTSQCSASPYLLNVSQIGAITATQGEKITITYNVENKGAPLTFDNASLEISPWQGTTITGGVKSTVALNPYENLTIVFEVQINENASLQTRYMSLTLEENNNIKYQNSEGTLIIKESLESIKSKEMPESKISFEINPKNGFLPGATNSLEFEFIVINEIPIEDAYAELILPEGFGVYNGNNKKNLLNIKAGRRIPINYNLYVDKDVQASFADIGLKIKGNLKNEQPIEISNNFNFPIQSNKSQSLINDLNITNVNTPNEVKGNKNFNLTFDVTNRGNKNLDNIKIFTELPDGIINKTKGVFVDSFKAGQTRSYSVTLYAVEMERKSYGVKIGVESTTSKEAGRNIITQYANVFVSGDGSGTVTKNPQLMVYDYSYGGTYVQAGSEFRLSMNFLNNSRETIKNIKVSVTEPNGMFVPSKSSNSFFLGSIQGKKSTGHSIYLRANKDAKQETAALTVEMIYENEKGESFTAKDVISVPVVQEQRLVIEELVTPPDLLVGNPAGISVVFYNMGKSILNNLRVTVNGDFDLTESNNYFVGNMEPGKSDTYDFSLIPTKTGVLNGAVKFTYEDLNGVEQQFEKPFTFQVGEQPIMEEPQGEIPEKEGTGGLRYLVMGLVAVILIITVAIIRKKRLIKKQNDLFDEL